MPKKPPTRRYSILPVDRGDVPVWRAWQEVETGMAEEWRRERRLKIYRVLARHAETVGKTGQCCRVPPEIKLIWSAVSEILPKGKENEDKEERRRICLGLAERANTTLREILRL